MIGVKVMREDRGGADAMPLRRPERRQRGFTLIEIMVALMLGLVVIIGVIQVFLGTQQSARIQQAASRMQEDGRIAVNLLTRYIRLAGYTTNPWDKGSTAWAPARGLRGFPTSALFTKKGQVISGDTGNINGMDSIRVRYQGASDDSITTCLGRIVPVTELADITLSLSADDPVNGRSLQCTDNNTGATEPLIGGLENIQIWYGISQDQGSVSGVDAAGRLTGATTYLTAAEVTANKLWDRVISVQISLLVRSDQDRLASQPQTYTFPITNNTPTTPTDQRLRYVMGATTNIRNQAP